MATLEWLRQSGYTNAQLQGVPVYLAQGTAPSHRNAVDQALAGLRPGMKRFLADTLVIGVSTTLSQVPPAALHTPPDKLKALLGEGLPGYFPRGFSYAGHYPYLAMPQTFPLPRGARLGDEMDLDAFPEAVTRGILYHELAHHVGYQSNPSEKGVADSLNESHAYQQAYLADIEHVRVLRDAGLLRPAAPPPAQPTEHPQGSLDGLLEEEGLKASLRGSEETFADQVARHVFGRNSFEAIAEEMQARRIPIDTRLDPANADLFPHSNALIREWAAKLPRVNDDPRRLTLQAQEPNLRFRHQLMGEYGQALSKDLIDPEALGNKTFIRRFFTE
ncbi:MAG: hypothetical protein IPK79_05170 [Vampirovibrionales bacterium]|nr:hypothetical protein [Vampirovibrionales bacterium]